MLAFRGLERTAVDVAEAGDIVAIAGITQATVADTLCDPEVTTPFLAQPIDPPTLAMLFRINDGPFAGQEGDKVQSRVIRDRLLKEGERNVAIRVTEEPETKDAYEVAGRGELQLGILIETMRREGFELTVLPAARAVQDRSGHRQAPGADRRGDRRRRRGARRHRRPEAVRAARRSQSRCGRPAVAGSGSSSTCRRAA